ncbi:hypothetical protein AGOR_G00199200 [Albula goreensis]|uniref:Pyrin domain-containing protein n=1 Tax=Albula goreensis TaxID=1534307 RepID=A0A8T3CWE6_9TELE|nr:hypothetical protein AGOR_G00199200 [Albula goreensis]
MQFKKGSLKESCCCSVQWRSHSTAAPQSVLYTVLSAACTMDGVPSLLVDALEQLQEKEVKRFKWTLTHDIPEGFCCIPRGQLEKRDIMDMVDLMVDIYEEEGAVRITLHVLQKINQNNVAKWLEQQRENAMTCTPKGRHESCSSADLVKGVQGKLKSRLRKKYELVLGGCGLTCDCCQKLTSVVLSGTSKLIELNLSNNDLQDAGVTLFCAGLGDPQCTLEKLSLSLCGVRDDGCVQLSSALHSNPSHLRELDLSFNYPGEPALDLLSKIQTDPSFRLQTLLVDYNGVSRNKQRLLKYA